MADLFFQQALLPSGWADQVRVVIDAGLIAVVAAGATPLPDDERHGIGLPGTPNLHSHAFQRGMAGLAETRGPTHDTFWTWREVMYRFALTMTPEDVEAVAFQLYVEMLESGFVRVGEFHYLHHDTDGRAYANRAEMAERIAAAAAASGIGLTLLPVFYAHGGLGGAAATAGQRRFLSNPDSFADLLEGSARALASLEGAELGIAPHSLRAVSPEELQAILPLAGNAPIHIHAAEQVKEVEDCLRWSGQRPVDWLLTHAPVDQRWCLIHSTHMTEDETRRLAGSGAIAGLCPITEANLGDGIFQGPVFMAAGGRFGVGSDSNVQLGPAEELRQLEYAQRLGRRERNVLALGEGQSTGRSLFDAAVLGGMAALGRSSGGIVTGASADLVSLDPAHTALVSRHGDRILDAWIFSGGAELIDCVWRHGRKLVESGRHRERERAEAGFRKAMARLC